MCRAEVGVAGRSVEAGSDGRSTHVDFVQEHHIASQIGHFLLQVVGKGVKLLSRCHGHGVLQLGASHLYHVAELIALGPEGGDELLQAGHERLVHTDDGVADGCGVGIVGGLSAVHVVVGGAVGVVAALMPHQFECTVGNDLVGVHVDRGSGTTLHHVDGEMVVPLAGYDFLARLGDGLGYLWLKGTYLGIGQRGRLLDVGYGDDEIGIVAHLRVGNLVIVDTTLCLHAIVGGSGHLELAQEVALHSEFLLFLFHIVFSYSRLSIVVGDGVCRQVCRLSCVKVAFSLSKGVVQLP